jgi:putative transposase
MMIGNAHKDLSIRQQCEILKIARSCFYYEPISRAEESVLANEIHELWVEWPQYGYRKITASLRRNGYEVNHKKVLRMMQDMNIQAMYPKPRTSLYNPAHKIYPYLLHDVEIVRPDQVWGTDITYIKMPNGFMYLVALIDWFSRFIVDWNLSNTLDARFCIEMLNNALKSNKPEIVNTDQGCQYTSESWINLVEKNEIKVSMDGKGRWADNIISERFWRTLKHEHVLLTEFETVPELRDSIGLFIDKYNYKRLHQSLGYRPPAEMYFLPKNGRQNGS